MIASSTETSSVTPVRAMSGVRALWPSSASCSSALAASTGCSTEWTMSFAFSWSCTIGYGYPDTRLAHQRFEGAECAARELGALLAHDADEARLLLPRFEVSAGRPGYTRGSPR